MFPTRPRPLVRSTCSSWTTPCSMRATRVSCGLTLMRISSFIAGALDGRVADPREQPAGLEQRQADDPGVAAGDGPDEHGSPPLDRIGAGLIERLPRRYVLPDIGVGQFSERDVGAGYRHFDLLVELDRDTRMDLMHLA